MSDYLQIPLFVKCIFHLQSFFAISAVLQEYFETFEPELKQARLGRKLVFRQFWAAGVNVLWCIDQHDKWKYKFGLCFHVAVDPFSGYLIWLRVWWNNSNPILICSYYLDAVSSLGCEL